MIFIDQFEYKDDEAIVERFKELLKPKSGSGFSEYSDDDIFEFEILMEWLNSENYIIKEFPNVIHQKKSLKSFGSGMIRSYILTKNPELKQVEWSKRRTLIDSLTVERKSIDPMFEISEDINNEIKEIAMGTGNFYHQTCEHKLALLNNYLEFLLKDGKNFKKINCEIFYGFISEESVVKFRKDTQIFRHHNKDAIRKRSSWSDEKKNFYIRIGTIIITELFLDLN